MRNRAFLAAAVLASLTSPAAASSLPGFVLAGRTERAAYFGRGSARPDVGRIEAYVKALESQLGARPAANARYYLYGSPEELAAGTGHYSAGVTFPGRNEVHSTQPFHRHELVHLVAGRLGDPGRFFQEGLAVALGDERRWRGRAVHALARRHAGARPLSELIGSFESSDPEVAYPVAGSFMAWLIDSHGLDRVSAFFAASGRGAAEAFERTFGVALDEAGRRWQHSL